MPAIGGGFNRLTLQICKTFFAKSMPITLDFFIVWTPFVSETPPYLGVVESIHRSWPKADTRPLINGVMYKETNMP